MIMMNQIDDLRALPNSFLRFAPCRLPAAHPFRSGKKAFIASSKYALFWNVPIGRRGAQRAQANGGQQPDGHPARRADRPQTERRPSP